MWSVQLLTNNEGKILIFHLVAKVCQYQGSISSSQMPRARKLDFCTSTNCPTPSRECMATHYLYDSLLSIKLLSFVHNQRCSF